MHCLGLMLTLEPTTHSKYVSKVLHLVCGRAGAHFYLLPELTSEHLAVMKGGLQRQVLLYTMT